MRNKFSLAYAKYSLALENDTITDEIRSNLCKLFNESFSIEEDPSFCSLLINNIFSHYAEKMNLSLAKDECLKLSLGPSIPNIQIFSSCLDLLSMTRNENVELQIEKIKEVFQILNIKDEYTKSFNMGILDLMLQRLITMSIDGKSGLVFNTELTDKIITVLEELSGEEDMESMEFIAWYIE